MVKYRLSISPSENKKLSTIIICTTSYYKAYVLQSSRSHYDDPILRYIKLKISNAKDGK